MSKPNYKKLQRSIAKGDGQGIESRWSYGRAILEDPAKISSTGKSLRHGAMEALIADAKSVGSTLSDREIQRRLQCARTYKTISQIRQAMADFGTWAELAEANFPEVTVDEDLAEPTDLEVDAANAWEQLTLLPGFKETVKVHGREMPITEMTVPESIAYRDKYRSMHEGFGKTLDLIERTVDAIIDGWDGNPETKAVDAYQRAIGDDEVAS